MIKRGLCSQTLTSRGQLQSKIIDQEIMIKEENQQGKTNIITETLQTHQCFQKQSL